MLLYNCVNLVDPPMSQKGKVRASKPLYKEAFFFLVSGYKIMMFAGIVLSILPVSFLTKILHKNLLTMVCFRTHIISNIQRFVFPV